MIVICYTYSFYLFMKVMDLLVNMSPQPFNVILTTDSTVNASGSSTYICRLSVPRMRQLMAVTSSRDFFIVPRQVITVWIIYHPVRKILQILVVVLPACSSTVHPKFTKLAYKLGCLWLASLPLRPIFKKFKQCTRHPQVFYRFTNIIFFHGNITADISTVKKSLYNI